MTLYPTVDQLKELLTRSWARETSSTPDEWSPENPSRGQCAVTALIVQDLFGGMLMRTTVGGESHYLNHIPAGPPVDEVRVDLTLDQFDRALYDHTPETRDREYVLSFPETVARYNLLKAYMTRRMEWDML